MKTIALFRDNSSKEAEECGDGIISALSPHFIIKTFTQEECIKSKRILFYTGFSNINWNYSYSINHALGGSETAVAYLSKAFPSDYEIYIGGSVGIGTTNPSTKLHVVGNVQVDGIITGNFSGYFW